MKLTFLLIFCIACLHLQAQFILQGQVKDAATQQPLSAASVFLNNTSIGTTSDKEGKFSLKVPQGKYDIVVTNIGYETKVTEVNNHDSLLIIYLKVKANELENVTVEAYEKDGWAKWGKFFTDNFIGLMPNAEQCELKNKEKIRFRNSKVNSELTAIAFEPIVIENKALGYILKFQLENFSYNFKQRMLYYEGYPLFVEMQGSERKRRQWEKKRAEAYYGSILHFMRSLYRNRLTEEGFEVRKLVRKDNVEKMRVKKVMADNFRLNKNRQNIVVGGGGDSSAYYNNILSQPDKISYLYKPLLPGDSIAYALDSTTAGLYFTDYLDIFYTKGKVPEAYSVYSRQERAGMISQITLAEAKEIAVFANGSYYQPRNIISEGYWGWSEKAGNMLPFDYKPALPPPSPEKDK